LDQASKEVQLFVEKLHNDRTLLLGLHKIPQTGEIRAIDPMAEPFFTTLLINRSKRGQASGTSSISVSFGFVVFRLLALMGRS
jgi:hypothetical protein